MFVSVSNEASECRLYAEHCADKAQLQSDPQLRQWFLEMQRRWLSLARSYEFAERLEFLSAVEEWNKEARLLVKDVRSVGSQRVLHILISSAAFSGSVTRFLCSSL